jgi:hypothetical protein
MKGFCPHFFLDFRGGAFFVPAFKLFGQVVETCRHFIA